MNVSGEAILANDFHLQGGRAESLRDARLALDAPIHIGRTVIPAHADGRYVDHHDGTSQLEAAGRLSANFGRFNLATDVHYKKQFANLGRAPPSELTLGLIGSGHIGEVRIRGTTEFDVSPGARLRTAELIRKNWT